MTKISGYEESYLQMNSVSVNSISKHNFSDIHTTFLASFVSSGLEIWLVH